MRHNTVTLLGHEYKLSMNFGALIAYERISGNNPLDFSQFSGGHIEPLIELGYAQIVACKENEPRPELEDILNGTNPDELAQLMQAASENYLDFLKVERGDKLPTKSESEETEHPND